MIPVAKLREQFDLESFYLGADLLGHALPLDGVVLSGDEVAQIRALIKEQRLRDATNYEPLEQRIQAALALLDSAGESR